MDEPAKIKNHQLTRRQVCLSLPQSDIELMTEKEDLGLKPPPRFEQTGDEYRKQTDDREYPVH